MKAAVRFGAVSVISKTARFGSVIFLQNIGSVRFGYLFFHVAVRCGFGFHSRV